MRNLPEKIVQELSHPFTITREQIDFFTLNGYIKIKNILSAELVQYMNETISSEVEKLNTQHLSMEERDTYGKAFLQITNIWTKSEVV